MKKDILYTYKDYNFFDGYKWVCVERRGNEFVLLNMEDKRIIVVRNARPCYILEEQSSGELATK